MNYLDIYNNWLADERLCAEGRKELESIKEDNDKIEYAFGAELEFGTAGMRGIIGYGTNKMNIYTVKRATQGLAEFIKTLGETAMARGIKAYLFDDVHPVPMLSFAVRNLKTIAGIMVTASHNPKEYNGYKVYGEDGAQMSPEDTDVVVKFIKEITDYLGAPAPTPEQAKKLIKPVPHKVDKKYYKELTRLTLSKKAVKACGKDLKLGIYSRYHHSQKDRRERDGRKGTDREGHRLFHGGSTQPRI